MESSWSPLPNNSRNDRETTGGNDGNDGGKRRKRRGKPRTGFLLNIRLGMLPTVVSTWYPVVSPCVLPGLWLKIRLEMLSFVVSWFPPRGVVVSCLVHGSKLDWKCCPPWCRGFHPVVSWCLAWFMA